MRSRSRALILAGVLGLCTLGVALSVLWEAPAFAAPTDSAEHRLAREEVNRGLEAARADRWDDARDSFDRAYALWKKPSILFNLAGAQAKTGRFVEAAESYRVILRSEDVGEKERALAKDALTNVEPRIAHLRIMVRGGTQSEDVLALDGRTLPLATVSADLSANPGAHTLTLARRGWKTPSSSVTLHDGESRTLTLVPVMDPVAPRPARSSGVASSDNPPPPSSRPLTSSPWFWIGIGVVVVGGTVTAVCLSGACSSSEAQPHQGTIGNVQFP